jgi:hypothetical protein
MVETCTICPERRGRSAQGRADQVDVAEEVRLDVAPEVVRRHVLDGADAAVPGVVDHDIKPAEGPGCILDRVTRRRRVGYVQRHHPQPAAAVAAQLV